MVGALNGISVLFSDAGNVDKLQRGQPRAIARLARLERTLRSCGAAVRRLGPAPDAFAQTRKEALRTCVSLERGAREVKTGIEAWQNGLGIDGIDRATETLSTGQDGIGRTRAELKAAAT